MPDWNQHYLSREVADQTPADVLLLNQHLLPSQGSVLDYASGLAGNGCWLAHRGYRVTAWDNSEIAVAKVNRYAEQYGLALQAEQHDLEQHSPPPRQFDLVLVSFFLHRPTLNQLQHYIAPGGLLFYQTFCGERIDERGPSNPDFRLQPGELLRSFDQLQPVYYREDGQLGDTDAGIRGQSLLVAHKPRS
jgi:2-polyprenyl-3-methyl-5-hydroxy-6-metoxy-1,4-benzoquinol methylase